WRQGNSESLWRDEAGPMLADRPDASAFGEVNLPVLAKIEFDISLTRRAEFLLAFGASPGGGQRAQNVQRINGRGPAVGRDRCAAAAITAFRIESGWNDHVVAVRELNRDADVADLGPLKTGAGHIHWQVYLDQKLGRMIVVDENGHQLADL